MKALEARSRAPRSVTCRTPCEVERLICTEEPRRSRFIREKWRGDLPSPTIIWKGRGAAKSGSIS